MAQAYAAKVHGFFGNIGRYIRNPLKDPVGSMEGIFGSLLLSFRVCLR